MCVFLGRAIWYFFWTQSRRGDRPPCGSAAALNYIVSKRQYDSSIIFPICKGTCSIFLANWRYKTLFLHIFTVTERFWCRNSPIFHTSVDTDSFNCTYMANYCRKFCRWIFGGLILSSLWSDTELWGISRRPVILLNLRCWDKTLRNYGSFCVR